jgi:hypothetical protein
MDHKILTQLIRKTVKFLPVQIMIVFLNQKMQLMILTLWFLSSRKSLRLSIASCVRFLVQ